MRSILSERNIVIALFVLVFITFSLAHEDSKVLEKKYLETTATATTDASPVEVEPAPATGIETIPAKQQEYIFVPPSLYRLQ
jgi:hypothetical protein